MGKKILVSIGVDVDAVSGCTFSVSTAVLRYADELEGQGLARVRSVVDKTPGVGLTSLSRPQMGAKTRPTTSREACSLARWACRAS